MSGGQSGQLLPCGQLKGELLDDLLLLTRIELLERLTTLLLTRIELLDRLAALLLGVTPLQTAPDMGGRCAALLATPLFPCTPNSID